MKLDFKILAADYCEAAAVTTALTLEPKRPTDDVLLCLLQAGGVELTNGQIQTVESGTVSKMTLINLNRNKQSKVDEWLPSLVPWPSGNSLATAVNSVYLGLRGSWPSLHFLPPFVSKLLHEETPLALLKPARQVHFC